MKVLLTVACLCLHTGFQSIISFIITSCPWGNLLLLVFVVMQRALYYLNVINKILSVPNILSTANNMCERMPSLVVVFVIFTMKTGKDCEQNLLLP